MSDCKISIIVPVYNAQEWLQHCLDSIASQDFESWQAILVDDGSVDESGEICDRYASADSRFIVVHKKNAGVSSTRNVGLENAVGKYIMFCDADDFVSEVWCEVMYNTALKYPNAWVVSNLEKVHSSHLYHYLHATGKKLGLLINFGCAYSLEFERIIL